MTAVSLSFVEPDMEISPIRLSPGSSMPESAHNVTSPRGSKCAQFRDTSGLKAAGSYLLWEYTPGRVFWHMALCPGDGQNRSVMKCRNQPPCGKRAAAFSSPRKVKAILGPYTSAVVFTQEPTIRKPGR